MLDTVYAIGDASSQVHSLSYMVYISTFQMHLPRKGFHFELFLFFFEFFLSQVLLKEDILANVCGEASGSHYVFSIANSVNIKCSYTT